MALEKGTKCVLQDLLFMSHMNGAQCKIVGSYRVNEDRYPVYVYKAKQTVLIKRENLKMVALTGKSARTPKRKISPVPILSQKRQNILETITAYTRHTKQNQAKLFANNVLKSNPQNMFDPKLNHDLKYMLNGNCIYIKSFFNPNKYNKYDQDLTLFNYLFDELCGNDMIEQFHRLMISNKKPQPDGTLKRQCIDDTISVTFKMITQCLAKYFDVAPHHTLINLYRSGSDYASFHSDSYDRDECDITIGASFGNKRDLAFLHKDTKETFRIKQQNCDVFAFTSLINDKFKHSILKTSDKIGPRFSVIVWGKRRTLNAKNSSHFERMEKKMKCGM
eukprot:677164_1